MTLAIADIDKLQGLLESLDFDLRDLADYAAPEEACGLLCHDGTIQPLINQARSTHRFVVSSTLLKEAIDELTSQGSFPIAVYHSHPTRTSYPSRQDEQTLKDSPDLISVIVGTDATTAWIYNDVLLNIAEVSHG